jgi:predicted HicB family RNase H-like nuclease
MAKAKTKATPKIGAKAQALLVFARERARHATDWVELHNGLFGISGKANELLTSESERTAFSRTKECKQILALLDGLPAPPVKDFGELLATANGAISVRLPRSVHAALLAEAKAEGVSLNQLCLSKLVAQLRAVV